MKTIKAVLCSAACMLAAFLPGLAHAMASGSVVFDPTNWLKNAQTAMQTAQQVSNQLRAYQLQLADWQRIQKDISGFSVSKLTGYVAPQTLKQITAIEGVRSDVLNMSSSLDSYASRLQERQAAAQLANMPVDKWYDMLKSDAAKGKVDAKRSIEQDQQVLNRSIATMQQVQDWNSQIPSIAGNSTGAWQTLVSQMNTMVAANSELLRYTAQSSAKQRSHEQESTDMLAEAMRLKKQRVAEDQAAQQRRAERIAQ